MNPDVRQCFFDDLRHVSLRKEACQLFGVKPLSKPGSTNLMSIGAINNTNNFRGRKLTRKFDNHAQVQNKRWAKEEMFILQLTNNTKIERHKET